MTNASRETSVLKNCVRLVLPYPVSANRYWQSFVPRGWTRAVVHPSTEAKAYKREVKRIAESVEVMVTDRPLELTITLCPRMNKDGSASATVLDLGNALKVAEDALQGIVYVNDKQVKALHLAYGAAVEDGALVVQVREFLPPPAALFAAAEEAAAA